tara:strand:- start:3290 stop:3919 length:630 start_codon:yes stop_codon:yes gene_type:complete
MSITKHFSTPIRVDYRPEFLKVLNKAADPYILKAKKLKKDSIKKTKDRFDSYHSDTVLKDPTFFNFREEVGKTAWDFLDYQGFDMSLYTLFFSEMWIQEFAKRGGGTHSAHTHWSQVVSGFYFLECNKDTAYPYFMDPRPGAVMTKLRLKNGEDIFEGSELIHYTPQPGDLMVFPGYLTHGFSVDHGLSKFRFIHFNIQTAPKEVTKSA